MRFHLIVTTVLGLVLAGCGGDGAGGPGHPAATTSPSSGLPWVHGLPEALAQAKTANQPIFVDFFTPT